MLFDVHSSGVHILVVCCMLYAADMACTLRFDAKTGDIKLFVDPLTNVQSAYCPQVCVACTCILHSMQLKGT